jgi:hypothetical protein
MASETKSPEPTPSESKQDATILSAIVKNLAESLIQSGGLLELGNELERKGMPNHLQSEMEEPEATKALLEVIQNHNLLPPAAELRQHLHLPPNERGLWALEELNSAISNQDSS